ncbi:MAG: hypothetical protein ACJ8ER_04470 [Allosphingosinicella sp.]
MLILMTGCTDLAAVNSVSTQMLDASQGWNPVAGEFQASCLRSNQFRDPPVSCETAERTSAGLQAANAILVAYFGALKKASADQAFSVDEGLATLSGSVAGIPGVDSGKVTAVSGLARFLIGLATDRVQEKTVRLLIAEAPAARAALDIEGDTVARGLGERLDAEEIQLGSTFRVYLQAERAQLGDPAAVCAAGPRSAEFRSGPAFLVALEYCRRAQVLAEKRAALDNYAKAVATTRTALGELEGNKSRLKAKALATRLYKLADELNTNVKAVRDAFEKGEA